MDGLFVFPQSAAYNRPVPKTKIYERAAVGASIKKAITQDIEKIEWSYKLAPETLNLKATPAVQEIQIFTLILRNSALKCDTLAIIDKTIPSPIIYQLCYQNRVKYAAAYKRPSEADKTKWVTSSYFETGWIAKASPQIPLPIALDLGILYEELLKAIISLTSVRGEKINAFVARAEECGRKQRDIEKLEKSLRQEKQFNRKVEINARIKTIQREIDKLKRGE